MTIGTTTRAVAAATVCAAILSGCGGEGSSPLSASTDPSPPRPLGTGAELCTNGSAGDFRCDGISLDSRVALDVMGGETGNDIWGWSDAQTGQEYALMGMNNGTAFVDVSDPENPVFLGRLPTQTEESFWRDVKVYRDHAYIVADNAGAHGMQVFDLDAPEGGCRRPGHSTPMSSTAISSMRTTWRSTRRRASPTPFRPIPAKGVCTSSTSKRPTIRNSGPVTTRPRRTTPSASSTGARRRASRSGRFASAPTKIISKWWTSPTSPLR